MRCRYLVPTLGLLTAFGSVSAVEVGGGLSLGGYVDTWLTFDDRDYEDDGSGAFVEVEDSTIDFTGEAFLNATWGIGDNVTGDFWGYFSSDGATLDTATFTWGINDQVSIFGGHYVNVLGWEAAKAPWRYRFDRSILVNQGALNFYGAAYNEGVGVFVDPTEELALKFFIQDHVFGEATGAASDSLGFIADAAYAIEGFGGVNVELVYDMEAAPLFGGDAEEDVLQIGANMTYTGTENLTIGAEIYWHDYDLAAGYGAMVLANYAFHEMASGSVWLAYGDPNDDDDEGGEDDEIMEVGAAILTTPTGDANFAVNAEVKFITYGDNAYGSSDDEDLDSITFVVEALAIIP